MTPPSGRTRFLPSPCPSARSRSNSKSLSSRSAPGISSLRTDCGASLRVTRAIPGTTAAARAIATPRIIGACPRCRINRTNSEFVFEYLGGAVDVCTAIFHLLVALSKLGQVFCDGAQAAWLARGQNVQGNPLGEMKFEFLGILVWGNLGKPGSAISNSNFPKRIALHCEPNRYGGIGSKQERGEFAFGPPVRNGRSCGRPA